MRSSFACFLLILISCQKEIGSEINTSTVSFTSLADFFNQNRNTRQKFTLPANLGGMVQGSKSGKFYFEPNCFVDKTGNLITGNVQLEISEIYTPGDMILNNMPTMSDGKPLESGGEFFIRATYNGSDAQLGSGKYIRIELPGKNLDGMEVFNGQKIADGSVNWIVNNTGINGVRRDSVGANTAYNLFSDSIQWINCDKFINDPKVSCSFSPTNCPNPDSTNIYVHLTGRNSVLNVYNYTTNSFQSDNLISAAATIVGICFKEGKLYASVSTAPLTNNSVYTLDFKPITSNELKNQLKQLK